MNIPADSLPFTPTDVAAQTEEQIGAAADGIVPSPTDKELVLRSCAGDPEAFAELIGRHERALLRLVQRYIRSDQDAQEVIQDVFVTTWKKLATFEERSQLSTWLYRVTVNASLMYLRGRRRHLQSTEVGMDAEAIAESSTQLMLGRGFWKRPDEQLESRELGHELEHALNSLPSSLRTVFELRAIEGRSTSQTAASLGISEATVKSRLFRARHELQGEIKRCWLQ